MTGTLGKFLPQSMRFANLCRPVWSVLCLQLIYMSQIPVQDFAQNYELVSAATNTATKTAQTFRHCSLDLLESRDYNALLATWYAGPNNGL